MLVQWLKTKNLMTLLRTFYKVRKTITQTMKSTISKKFKIDELNNAISFYLQHMSEGKVLIEPWADV